MDLAKKQGECKTWPWKTTNIYVIFQKPRQQIHWFNINNNYSLLNICQTTLDIGPRRPSRKKYIRVANNNSFIIETIVKGFTKQTRPKNNFLKLKYIPIDVKLKGECAMLRKIFVLLWLQQKTILITLIFNRIWIK